MRSCVRYERRYGTGRKLDVSTVEDTIIHSTFHFPLINNDK